jgi:formylglycine-generating enzyme required for sulfatase activity
LAECEERVTPLGWWQGNSSLRKHVPGELPPNPAGLYDMHGNLYEWCRDAWDGQHPLTGGVEPLSTLDTWARVLRGGGYNSIAPRCRSARRNWNNFGTEFYGFRLGARIVPH